MSTKCPFAINQSTHTHDYRLNESFVLLDSNILINFLLTHLRIKTKVCYCLEPEFKNR